MFDVSTLLSNEIDILDREILFLILKRNPSSYSVWAAMNKQMQGRGLAYVNVKKRIRRMVEIDILEPALTPEGALSIRGRKEYKLTMKGMEQLIPYILVQQVDGKTTFEYIERYGLDKQVFVNLFTNRLANTIIGADSLYKYLNTTAKISSRKVSNIRIEGIKDYPQPIELVGAATAKELEAAYSQSKSKSIGVKPIPSLAAAKRKKKH